MKKIIFILSLMICSIVFADDANYILEVYSNVSSPDIKSSPVMAFDGKTDTAWMVNVKKNKDISFVIKGRSELYSELDLKQINILHGFGLLEENGAKAFKGNYRLKTVNFYDEGDLLKSIKFDDNCKLQEINGNTFSMNFLKLKLIDYYPGTKSEIVCVSEIQLIPVGGIAYKDNYVKYVNGSSFMMENYYLTLYKGGALEAEYRSTLMQGRIFLSGKWKIDGNEINIEYVYCRNKKSKVISPKYTAKMFIQGVMDNGKLLVVSEEFQEPEEFYDEHEDDMPNPKFGK